MQEAKKQDLTNLCPDFNILPLNAVTNKRAMAKDFARHMICETDEEV